MQKLTRFQMKKLSIVVCILLWALAPLSAQDYYTSEDFDVQLSKPFPVVDAVSKLYLNSTDHVVSFKRRKNNSFIIQTFDAKTLTETSRFEDKFKESYAELENFMVINERFYIFYSMYDKRGDIENLMVVEIDPNTSKFKGDPKTLLSVQGKVLGDLVSGGAWSFRTVNKFSFEYSKSKNNILIHHRMKPEFRNDNVSYMRVGLYVFDRDLNQTWGDIREMKYTEAQMELINYNVDHEGNAYILGKIYKDGKRDQKRRKDEEINYTYELMTFSGSNDPAVHTELELDANRFIRSAALVERDDNNLVIAGYYKNAYTSATQGAFVFNFDKSTKNYTKDYYAIPLDILNAYQSKRAVKKNTKHDDDDTKGGLFHLKADHIYLDGPGNITIIGEQFQIIQRTTTDSKGRSRTTYEYHYSDIVVMKVTPSGELAWITRIPKHQKGARIPGGMSYSMMGTDNHLYLLYLDHIKNNDLEIDKEPAVHIDGQGGFLTSSKINFETGELSKENLFDMRKVNGIPVYQFSTDRVLNLSQSQIAVEVYKKKKQDVWIKVGLN